VIARIWKGITREEDRDSYFAYLNKTGLPIAPRQGIAACGYSAARSTAKRNSHSYRSGSLGYPSKPSSARSQKVVYYPGNRKFLLELEPHVTHYEVLASPCSIGS